MEEIRDERGRAKRMSVAIMVRERQAYLILPEHMAREGDRITYYKPEGGRVLFRIGVDGRRAIKRASNTAVSWRSCLPVEVARKIDLSIGTHNIDVVDAGGGILSFRLDMKKGA